MKETKSNWACVTEELIKKPSLIELGRYVSYWFHKTPRRLLHSMSYYKFASKMIGKNKKVLEIGCNEGLGTYLIAKECGYAKGIDFDEEAIATAKHNFPEENLEFCSQDALQMEPTGLFDAVINFDVIEHIYPEHEDAFFSAITSQLSDTGLTVIGTPSLISQDYASEISKKGHVNVYSPERLERVMRKYFSHVFMFAANDEVIHTGYLPLAHYLIAVGCKKKPLKND
ncbi:MAG: class I SAM-dependent methyltransferase [Simkaniaceae bacterium]|nr:class I SAM-dependent methyltransferase [Simkaniaceae bacterium]